MAEITDRDVALRDVVDRIAASGSDLGTGVRVVGTERAVSRFAALEMRDQVVPLGADNAMRNLALARSAEVGGRGFAAANLKLGFMLAHPETSVANHQRQLGQMKSATVEDLQDVLRVTAERRGDLEREEPRLRAEAAVRFNPARVEEVYAKQGFSRDDAGFEQFVGWMAKADFGVQRDLSRAPDGTVPAASQEVRTSIAALGRGYQAIAASLRARGIEPAVMLKGASTGRDKGGPAAKVANRFVAAWGAPKGGMDR